MITDPSVADRALSETALTDAVHALTVLDYWAARRMLRPAITAYLAALTPDERLALAGQDADAIRAETLRDQAARMEVERGRAMVAIKNCPASRKGDYWRWQGLAAARRQDAADARKRADTLAPPTTGGAS